MKTNLKILLFTALMTFGSLISHAQSPPGLDEWEFPTNLNSWSFNDTNSWFSDNGSAPVSFTNIIRSQMGDIGDGFSVTLDSNNPAWLQYHVNETNGATNLTVDVGSVMLWFAPSWASASTNHNGSGPGTSGRLLEVGSYTSDASYGWWSLFLDSGGTNIYFEAQTNSGDSATVTYLSAPVDWASNEWHMIVLTYSSTNAALYFDGELMTNGAGITVFPGPNVLTNGFLFGSDSNGTNQAIGGFDDIYTYDHPLDTNDIAHLYSFFYQFFIINPFNIRLSSIHSAPSLPGNPAAWNAVTGTGFLQAISTNLFDCITSSDIWLTNISASVMSMTTNGMKLTTTIAGGTDGVLYDVFGNSLLDFSSNTNTSWAWLGQGYHCVTYSITNLPGTCFAMLGKPQDTDGDGLSDAYERLVSHTNPYNADTDGDGMFDGWEIAKGLNPLISNQPYTSPATTLTITKPANNTQIQ